MQDTVKLNSEPVSLLFENEQFGSELAQGAFRMQIAGSPIDSLDAHVQLVPGLAVKLIRVTVDQ